MLFKKQQDAILNIQLVLK